jgi:hypothetical protein
MKVIRRPKDDDGWYDTDVWDCPNPECKLTRMSPEVETCLLCNTPQPEGAVYVGRCWGIKMVQDPTIKLTDLPRHPLIRGPRSESLKNIRDISDDFLQAMGLPVDEVSDDG